MADDPSAQPRYLVVVGGDPAAPIALGDPGGWAGATVVAADSGLDRALAAGVGVHHLVGDLDSVSAAALTAARAAGTVVHRHEADKDATDLELALDLVRSLAAGGPHRSAIDPVQPDLVVVGAGGGRLDHQLGDLLVLAGPDLSGFDVTARFGPAVATVVRPGRPRRLRGAPGRQVSLLAVHGLVRGVTTSGLRWPLVDADLVPGTSRAMSNELVGVEALVAVGEGVLVAVEPGTVAAPIPERTGAYDPTPRSTHRRNVP